MRLTDISIRSLPQPEKGQKTYSDDALSGFGVRVSQGGTKTFVVVHGPTRERLTIGRYPVLSLADARAEAKRLLAERTLGKHRPKSVTFDEARDEFLKEKEASKRANTIRDYKRLLKRFPFGRTRLTDIRRADVKKKLDKMAKTPSEQKHALVAIKTFFRWCVASEYLEHSPCEGIKPPQTRGSRQRVLSPVELAEVLRKARSCPYPFGPIVQLLVLTGQRRTEIAHLEWEWIDRAGQTITLPASITKNKREHTFPYGDEVAAILERLPILDNAQYLFPATREHVRGKPTTVFNGWGKAKAAFDLTLTKVEPWTLHDLRRTMSTTMAPLGIPQLIMEKLLNHVTGGEQSAIAQVYNKYNYLPEMREAVLRYETHLQSILPKG
jgi:integrase